MIRANRTGYHAGRRALTICLAGVFVVASCTAAPKADHEPPTPISSQQSPASIRVEDFSLSTHCGIYTLTYRGRHFLRKGGPADDGQGNPPDGWNNGIQIGTLTICGTSAVFTDEQGHYEEFAERTENDPENPLCD